ncbi:Sodium/hydrogen exchanger family-domain-containing protein [Daedaleopsis nitida]|nr:Sodium/hydrogen exchanger family-domain-containing protein [Daedaleopsis nitida]
MGAFSDDVISLARRAAAPEQAGIFAGDNPSHYNAADPIRLWVIQVVVIIGMTQLLALLLSRIRQPRVIAEVIGGVILGPSVMGHIPNFTATIFPVDSMPILNLTANLGLVLFLFLIGMEIDMRVIRKNAKASFAISVTGLIIPLGLGAALAVPVYNEFTDGTTNFGLFTLFIAVAVGITAFPVLCRILTELKLLDTTVGVVVLSAGVGNDVVGWILLALTVALINASNGLTAVWILLTGVGYVIFLCYPVRLAYRWLAKKSGSLDAGTPSAMMMTVTLLLVLISAFFTDIIGIHAIFASGGFLAGLIIPKDNGYVIALVEKVEDLVSILLLPLYFALSGLRTNLGLLDNGITWGYVVFICVIAFFSKFVGCAVTAKLSGFNLRESAAIGTLMSCKGLVELIVLNVGFTANILDTRTFSMFVLHALVLTFMTTPLTILFYPSKYRVHAGGLKQRVPGSEVEEGSGAPKADLDDVVKTRFAVVVERLEHLPAVMTLTSLLQSQSAATLSRSHEENASTISSTNEKAALEGPDVPVLARHSTARTTQISVDALRLIELTNRTSAVLKSQEAETLVHSDPVLAIFKTHGYLNRMAVSTSLAVVGHEDFSDHVAQHVRNSASQMAILPWTSGLASIEEAATNDASGSGTSPFDALFQQKREGDHHAVTAHANYIRRVFAEVPADVALFWDRGFTQSMEGPDARYHVYMPFFGGPDDRVALSFVVQLCRNASVTATVVKMRKFAEDDLSPMTSIDEAKAQKLLHTTVHGTVFPDTIYGTQTTQTRLASDTADDLLWTKLTTSAVPELASALTRITFVEKSASKPLHTVVELAAGLTPIFARQLVVVGRSRRMAVESHHGELQELCVGRNASIGSELPKTVGHVASAFIASGSSASLLIIQASQKQ